MGREVDVLAVHTDMHNGLLVLVSISPIVLSEFFPTGGPFIPACRCTDFPSCRSILSADFSDVWQEFSSVILLSVVGCHAA